MGAQRRRYGVLAVLAVAVVPLAVAATAFACARLATLKLNRASATEGTTVTATGRNFNSNASSSTIKLRFNSRNGKVLWEGRPNSKGKFTATFEVPEASKGYYVVMATQSLASGVPAAGTPGRTSLRIRGARASKRGTAVAVPVAGTPGGGTSAPGVIGLTAALLAVAGGAFWLAAAGLRRTRRRGVTVLGRA